MSAGTDPERLRYLGRAARAAMAYANAGSTTEAADCAELLAAALDPLGITADKVASAYRVQAGHGDAPAVVRARPSVVADTDGNPVAAWPWRPADGLEDLAARLLRLVVALEAGGHGVDREQALAWLASNAAALKAGTDARRHNQDGHQEGLEVLRTARANGGRAAARARRKLPDTETLERERAELIQAQTHPRNVAAKLAARYGVTARAVREALKEVKKRNHAKRTSEKVN